VAALSLEVTEVVYVSVCVCVCVCACVRACVRVGPNVLGWARIYPRNLANFGDLPAHYGVQGISNVSRSHAVSGSGDAALCCEYGSTLLC